MSRASASMFRLPSQLRDRARVGAGLGAGSADREKSQRQGAKSAYGVSSARPAARSVYISLLCEVVREPERKGYECEARVGRR